MTDVLDIAGLASLILMGFLLAIWLGFGLVGVACLWSSYSLTARQRKAAEVQAARRIDRR